ncbi:MAG: MFS transporter [Candidatus Hermodarchaeota archaeon]
MVNFFTIMKSMNHNVKLVFAFTFFQSFGRGIWMGNVLSSYIFLIANESNELLGITSAITGVAMTMTVIPSGIVSDRFPRHFLLRGAAVIGFIGLLFALAANSLEIIFLALLFWGLFQGMNRPSLESIFADSVESGDRSKIYAWNHLTRQFAMSAGPFVNVGLFLILGDFWDLRILKSVLMVGILISMISLVIMVFLNDKRSLGEASEHLNSEYQKNNNNVKNNEVSNLYISNNKNQVGSSRKKIIFILMASNLIIGMGAGMTIKFFPIFFMQIYTLAPIGVQLIMGATSILTGLTALGAQNFSLRRGRAEMIFVVQAIATSCLFLIALYPPIFVLIPIFLARGSLMNASQPLSRSILMDVVPKYHRGKVNSFQALAWGLFWNFSAAIGGFLIGPSNNYRLCFLITAGVYVTGTLPIILLIPLVAKEKNAT